MDPSPIQLTPDDHHADSENLLVVCFWSHVSKADTRHACHGEVERRDVHRAARWTFDQFHSERMIAHRLQGKGVLSVGLMLHTLDWTAEGLTCVRLPSFQSQP